MNKENQPLVLIVRWIPLLTMDWKWEAIWRQTIQTFNPNIPIREFIEDKDTESHLHFLVYEARWHKRIYNDGVIATSLQERPPSRNSRIILVACDQVTKPKINERHVEELSVETLNSVGRQRHVSRAYTPEKLREDTEIFLVQSILEHGFGTDDQAPTPDLYQQYLAPPTEGNDSWDSSGI